MCGKEVKNRTYNSGGAAPLIPWGERRGHRKMRVCPSQAQGKKTRATTGPSKNRGSADPKICSGRSLGFSDTGAGLKTGAYNSVAADRCPAVLSGVPGDAGEFFFAGFPFGAEEDARADFDEAAGEDEDAGGIPGTAVAVAVSAGVEGIGHAAERNTLDDKLGKVAERAHFERVVFEVLAVGGYPQSERNFFGSAFGDVGGRLARYFHFAFPFHGHQGPASVVHFGEIS